MRASTPRVLATVLAACAPLAAAGAAVAHPDHPDHQAPDHQAPEQRRAAKASFTYTLPGERVFPEGIAVTRNERRFFVTSTTDGTIFRGRLGDPDTEVFLPGGEDGRTFAVGLASTARRLLVAGGPTGQVFVYDRASGEFLGSFTNGRAEAGEPTFVNDLRVAPSGDVFATDSAADVVYRIPARDVRGLEGEAVSEPVAVFAEFASLDPTGAFNANGVVVTRDGRYLVVVQSDTGALFRVATDTGEVRRIEVEGSLTAGDGMSLRGRTLLVVERTDEVQQITRLWLSEDLTSARVFGAIADSTFDDPTTTALARQRVLVVNSQFGERSAGEEPTLPFTVSSVPRA